MQFILTNEFISADFTRYLSYMYNHRGFATARDCPVNVLLLSILRRETFYKKFNFLFHHLKLSYFFYSYHDTKNFELFIIGFNVLML